MSSGAGSFTSSVSQFVCRNSVRIWDWCPAASATPALPLRCHRMVRCRLLPQSFSVPTTSENTDVASGAVPAGCTGCYVTLIGGGGEVATLTTMGPRQQHVGIGGGGGGGGGGKITRTWDSRGITGFHLQCLRRWRGEPRHLRGSGRRIIHLRQGISLTARGGASPTRHRHRRVAPAGTGGTCTVTRDHRHELQPGPTAGTAVRSMLPVRFGERRRRRWRWRWRLKTIYQNGGDGGSPTTEVISGGAHNGGLAPMRRPEWRPGGAGGGSGTAYGGSGGDWGGGGGGGQKHGRRRFRRTGLRSGQGVKQVGKRKPDHMKTRMAVAFSDLHHGGRSLHGCAIGIGWAAITGNILLREGQEHHHKYRPGTPTRTDSLGHIKPSKPDANS